MRPLFILFIALVLFRCSSAPDEKVETSMSHFKKMVKLPAEPSSVKWIIVNQGEEGSRMLEGPGDYYLLAIVSFREAEFDKLQAALEQHSTKSNNVTRSRDFIRDWFPPSIKASFTEDDDGTEHINQAVYDAKDLGVSPLIHGDCFLTENNEMLLYLYTM